MHCTLHSGRERCVWWYRHRVSFSLSRCFFVAFFRHQASIWMLEKICLNIKEKLARLFFFADSCHMSQGTSPEISNLAPRAFFDACACVFDVVRVSASLCSSLQSPPCALGLRASTTSAALKALIFGRRTIAVRTNWILAYSTRP